MLMTNPNKFAMLLSQCDSLLRNHIGVGGVINRPAGAQGWHLAGASGLRLGEGGSVSVTPPLPSVERRA